MALTARADIFADFTRGVLRKMMILSNFDGLNRVEIKKKKGIYITTIAIR